MTAIDNPKMRTSDVLRALADQLDALGNVLNHPITATIYDFGYKHEVSIQPFGDDDQHDAALAYAVAAELGAEIDVRQLDAEKVSVQFATEFSGVKLTMFSHVGHKAADRTARDAEEQTARDYEVHEANEAWLDAHPDDYEAEDDEAAPNPAETFDGLGSTWADPAVQAAVRETIAEGEVR